MRKQAVISSAFVVCALAQPSTPTATPSGTAGASSTSDRASVTVFLPPEATADGFVATVVSADPCATTYGFACTSGSFGGTVPFCEPSYTPQVTYYGTQSFSMSHSFSVGGGVWTFMEGCSIHGSTEAVCARTYHYGGSKKATINYSTTTLTGDEVVFATVPITAGANKLVGIKSTSSCPAPSTSTSAGAAAASTGGLYRAQLLAGAAGLLVGAVV